MKRLFSIFCASLIGACLFGAEGDATAEQKAQLQALATLLGASSSIQLQLRSADGGLDTIQDFTENTFNIHLTAMQVHFYRAEIGLAPLALNGRTGERSWLDRLGGILGRRSLQAHGEAGSAGGGASNLLTDINYSLDALSPAASGSELDLGGHPYNRGGPLEIFGAFAVANAVRLHGDRLVAAGTINGAAFAVVANENFDWNAALACPAKMSPARDAQAKLLFNYSHLFEGVAAATQDAVQDAIHDNLASSDVLSETECFHL
ncbi:MAG: hypothetical protein K1X75_00870 [Leptospirales bacterium]|nr:hypothetical protein [Leptospirales bacterium]